MTTPTASIDIESHCPEDTADFAKRLAESIPPGTTVALLGTLGAGKTFLTQCFAEACGVAAGSVVSPTFVIYQPHEGKRFRINHLDVYRLNDGNEFLDLGADEMMESDAVQFIEWADRVADYLPDEHLEIQFTVTGENARQIQVTAHGQRLCEFLVSLVG